MPSLHEHGLAMQAAAPLPWSGCDGERSFKSLLSNEIKGVEGVCDKARAFGRVLQGGRKSLYVMSVMYFF